MPKFISFGDVNYFKYLNPSEFPCVYCDEARWVGNEGSEMFSCESCGCTTTGNSIILNGLINLGYVCSSIKFQIIPSPIAYFGEIIEGRFMQAPALKGSSMVMNGGIAISWTSDVGSGRIKTPFLKEDYPDLSGEDFHQLVGAMARLDVFRYLMSITGEQAKPEAK